jgi:glycosyltransferase involved in cell wall biosynthesis
VAERVTFAGNQSAEGVRDWQRRAAVAVNLSPLGLFDKAALEGMAVGVPTIVGSSAFDDVIGDKYLRLDDMDDATALALRLRDVLAMPEAERRKLGMIQRNHVVKAHSLDGLIGKLVNVLNTGEVA